MKLNIWLILDGKRGHEKQIEDLAFCINKKIQSNITKIQRCSFFKVILNFLKISDDACKNLPGPDLIIASGHRTHFDALQKRSRYGGKVIIVMKPSIPTFIFDLSIISFHDKIIWKKNIFFTFGSLNKVKNKKKQIKNNGLILLGGPSKNYFWSNENVANEIKKIINSNPNINFTLATSRRTPNLFIKELNLENKNLKIISHEKTSSDWLEKVIGNYEYSWVTQDSISMLFELIASGSKVTCISLKNKNNKFQELYKQMYEDNLINFNNMKYKKVKSMSYCKSSAENCADYICENILDSK